MMCECESMQTLSNFPVETSMVYSLSVNVKVNFALEQTVKAERGG